MCRRGRLGTGNQILLPFSMWSLPLYMATSEISTKSAALVCRIIGLDYDLEYDHISSMICLDGGD